MSQEELDLYKMRNELFPGMEFDDDDEDEFNEFLEADTDDELGEDSIDQHHQQQQQQPNIWF